MIITIRERGLLPTYILQLLLLMAVEQMKKVTGHLSCPICYELYKKPKYLPCYHSYCEECLVKLVVQSNITCPECRKTSVVPSGGVKQLPNNFFINRLLDEVALKRKVEGEEEAECDLCVRKDAVEVLCLDCGAFLCTRCFDNHKYSKEYQNHNMMPINELRSKKKAITIKPKSKFALCQEHELELNFYCETCDQLVCHYCIMKDHLKHDHDTVKKMATKHRKQLDKIMEPVEKMIEGLSVARKKVSNTRNKIGVQADDIDKEIDRYYEELHRRLQQQRDELKKELHETCGQNKKEVALQLEQMEHTQAQLQSIKELNGAMKNGSDQEALLMKKQIVNDVKRISDSYNKLDTQPMQSATMEFVPVEEYKISTPMFRHLFYDDVCPVNCETLGIPEMISEGEEVKFKIASKNRSNCLCQKGGRKVVIQAQSSRGDVTPVEVVDNKDGSYSASFVANQVGEVKLSISIKGEQIKGSPFNVKVHGKYTAIDKPSKVVNEGGRMGTPWGIAFGRNDMWAVTDNSNPCVWIFDREDQLVRKFGSYGKGNGKFSNPLGVAFDANNHLYVTDHNNHRVQKFNINGAYLFQFGTQGSGNGQLQNPLGIIVHNGKLYVAEYNNHCISVFQLDGQFSHIIGSGHLSNPYYIAVSTNDQLLVANSGHHCISIFTLDGNYVGKFGTQGTGRGQLSYPIGIATDMYGFILVTDCDNNRVSIFDKDDVFVHSFGSKGSGHGQFSLPYGIAISPTGDIYISDYRNNRIQIFST